MKNKSFQGEKYLNSFLVRSSSNGKKAQKRLPNYLVFVMYFAIVRQVLFNMDRTFFNLKQRMPSASLFFLPKRADLASSALVLEIKILENKRLRVLIKQETASIADNYYKVCTFAFELGDCSS